MSNWAELVDPFREHLLQQLPAASLARLQSTCHAFRALVDRDTGGFWAAAAEQLMTADSIPMAADGHAVQQRLRQQATVFAPIAAGAPSSPAASLLSCWPPFLLFFPQHTHTHTHTHTSHQK